MIELWIAEFDNGSIIFDSQPSHNDIRNVCWPDAEGDIEVYELACMETKRTHCFTIRSDSGEGEE